MRILIVTQVMDKDHPILGFFHRWVEEFAKHFAEVNVICLQKGRCDLPHNVHIYSLGKETRKSRLLYIFKFYQHFGSIFLKQKNDYVFFHMGAIFNILASPFFFLRFFYKTKFYWWKAHGHINTIGKFALLFVDRVITSTASGFPISTKKRKIVGQAIDTDTFTFKKEQNRHQLIFVGRIMPVKHLEVFLETYVLLREAGFDLGVKIVGPLDDVEYVNKLKAYCSENNIDQNIFIGPRTQKELVMIYQNANIFLNTSLTHSMDKTVLEASLCGCLPITGNKAFRELLQDEALFMSEPTAESYAQAIIAVLARTDLDTVRQRLAKKTSELHSLETFPHRIFNL